MRILVTGGAGFIGSHLSEKLMAEGHEVTILDDLSSGKRGNVPAGAQLIVDDIARAGVFDDIVKNTDACFHLAAIASVQQSKQHWLRAHQVNLGGTVALFDAIMRSGRKLPVVFASSAAVYGDNKELPLAETARCHPLSGYGVDKLSCEWQGRMAWNAYGIPCTGLRFFNVYGPRQAADSPYSGVISIFADRLKQKLPLTIYGDGEQSRDFIYVADIVAGMTAAMQRLQQTPGFGIYNLCTGTPVTVNTLAATLGEILRVTPDITYAPPREGDILHSAGDPSQAKNSLGVKSATSLKEGLTQWLDH